MATRNSKYGVGVAIVLAIAVMAISSHRIDDSPNDSKPVTIYDYNGQKCVLPAAYSASPGRGASSLRLLLPDLQPADPSAAPSRASLFLILRWKESRANMKSVLAVAALEQELGEGNGQRPERLPDFLSFWHYKYKKPSNRHDADFYLRYDERGRPVYMTVDALDSDVAYATAQVYREYAEHLELNYLVHRSNAEKIEDIDRNVIAFLGRSCNF